MNYTLQTQDFMFKLMQASNSKCEVLKRVKICTEYKKKVSV